MRINDLAIEQFRGIKYLRLKKLSDVNLLLGSNDAGKTSVLEAVKLLESPRDIDAIVRNSRIRFLNIGMPFYYDSCTQFGSFLDLFPFDQDASKYISIGAETDRASFQWIVKGETSHVLRPVSERELYGRQSYRGKEERLITEQDVLSFYGSIIFGAETIPIELDEFFRYQAASSQAARMFGPIIYVAPGDHLSSRMLSSVFRASKRREREIVELLRFVDPEIEGFKLKPNNMTNGTSQVIEHRRFGDIPLYTYGDGMKKILALAANVVSAKNGILLIDEIETSLQASNLERIFNWLLQACRRSNVQLFVTTHSLEAVSALVACAVRDDECELACYRLEKSLEQVYAKRFSERDLDSLVNGRGIDVR